MTSSATVHYVIGRNLAGYLPESDPICYGADWQAAADGLADMMREYADEDDSATLDVLDDNARRWPADYPIRDENGTPDYGDDAPSMAAHVGAILTDDGPRVVGAEWGAIVDDGSDRPISFWLAVVPAENCENEHDED